MIKLVNYLPHVLLTITLAALTTGCASTTQSNQDAGAAAPGATENGAAANAAPWEVGNPAPHWTLENGAGQTRSLEDYRGKVVLLDFWATWCPPCRRAMPALQQLHELYADEPVVVLGLSVDQQPQKAVDYVNEHGFTYESLIDADAVSDQYGVTGIPTLVVVGPDGRIMHRHVGFTPNLVNEMREVIDQALEDNAM